MEISNLIQLVVTLFMNSALVVYFWRKFTKLLDHYPLLVNQVSNCENHIKNCTLNDKFTTMYNKLSVMEVILLKLDKKLEKMEESDAQSKRQ